MRFNEEFFIKLAKPVSDTEDKKCLNAIDGVVKALKKEGWTRKSNLEGYERFKESETAYKTTLNLNGKTVKVLIQGSYANNTNVRKESDVDIAVVLTSSFRPTYRKGVSGKNYGFSAASYNLEDLKRDVHKALKDHLYNDVKPGCKSLKVMESTTTVPTDVVPALQKRDYTRDYSFDENNFVGGIIIRDSCKNLEIINFPEQHIENGISKNKNTNFRYKKIVRIFKNLKNRMKNENIALDGNVSSFLIESLVYNVPNNYFKGTSSLRDIVKNTVSFWSLSITSNKSLYMEANDIKVLFDNSSKYNAAINFLGNVRKYLEV